VATLSVSRLGYIVTLHLSCVVRVINFFDHHRRSLVSVTLARRVVLRWWQGVLMLCSLRLEKLVFL